MKQLIQDFALWLVEKTGADSQRPVTPTEVSKSIAVAAMLKIETNTISTDDHPKMPVELVQEVIGEVAARLAAGQPLQLKRIVAAAFANEAVRRTERFTQKMDAAKEAKKLAKKNSRQ